MATILSLNRADIQGLAYRLWEERNRPLWSAETDWLSAEQILAYRATHPVPSILACGCDDIKTGTGLTAGWTYFALPEHAVAGFVAKARKLLPSGLTEFHAKDMDHRNHSGAYEGFLELVRDTIDANPYAFVRTVGRNLIWGDELGGFSDRMIQSILKTTGAQGKDTERLLQELAPPIWTLQRLIRHVGNAVSLSLDVDEDSVLTKLTSSKTTFGATAISTSRLLALLCNAYAGQLFPDAPRVPADGSSMLVKPGAQSFLIQAADVVGNFAFAHLTAELGVASSGRQNKSQIFQRVFGAMPQSSVSGMATLSGQEFQTASDGEIHFHYADEFYEL
jgi:hypothetical protein